VLDYYMFPRTEQLPAQLDLAEDNHACLDVYRFKNLAVLSNLIRTGRIEDVA
jgi:hypothetical protein